MLGASVDTVESHRRWDGAERFGFVLLADADGRLADAFGVLRGAGPFRHAARTTFVIGPDGHIEKVYPRVQPRGHATLVLTGLP